MRISDWSSDVCSSDLQALRRARHQGGGPGAGSCGHDGTQGQGGEGPHRRYRVPLQEEQDRLREGLGRDPGRRQGDGEAGGRRRGDARGRSEEHTSELQSLMRISYAVFCLKKKKSMTQKQKQIAK